MLFVFVDETGDEKRRDYLGFCIATVNSRSYPRIKTEAKKILSGIRWDPNTEFKGSYLFSRSKGCPDVEIEQRIEAAHKLLDLNISLKNSRMKFYYGSMASEDKASDYLVALPELMAKLPKAPKGAGKSLVAVVCDDRSDVSGAELHPKVRLALEARGYCVFEQVVQATSSTDTVGLMFADLVAYLAGRVDIISNDSELFEGLTTEQLASNGKIKKLQSSTDLISKIKALEVYRREPQKAAT